jgi:hypothetical protein
MISDSEVLKLMGVGDGEVPAAILRGREMSATIKKY